MTALMPERTETDTIDPVLMDELRDAVDAFFTSPMTYTSGVPVAAVNGLRNPDACVFTTTVHGDPITVTKDAGALPPPLVCGVWWQIQELAPTQGVHVHVTPDDVYVESQAVVL